MSDEPSVHELRKMPLASTEDRKFVQELFKRELGVQGALAPSDVFDKMRGELRARFGAGTRVYAAGFTVFIITEKKQRIEVVF